MDQAEVVLSDEFITIGQFAGLSGLSIHTLRHWSDVGLLVPAAVDEVTRYRRYRRDQLDRASRIQALRRVDLPIDEIQRLLNPAVTPDDADQILHHHRDRLVDQHELSASRLREVDRFLKEGVPIPTVQVGCRPVQIRLPVDDLDVAVAFYQQAFDLRCDVRYGDDDTSRTIVFGEHGKDNFFVLVLVSDIDDIDRPASPGTFGFYVDDVDAAHQRAVAAGGTGLVAPHQPDKLSRCSAVADPARNWIWLDRR